MTFEDLPPDWPTRSLADPAIAADVVDLVVSESDRAGGCVGLLLCREGGELAQPVIINDVDDRCPAAERTEVLSRVLDHLGTALGGLVVAIGRPGSAVPTDADRQWHQCVIAASRAAGVLLHSTHLVTPGQVELLPVAEGLAA